MSWDDLYNDNAELASNSPKLESNKKKKKSQKSTPKIQQTENKKSEKGVDWETIQVLDHEIYILHERYLELGKKLEKLESNLGKNPPEKDELASNTNFPIENKILDIDLLWGEICRLSDDFTISSLLLWLAKIDRNSLSKLDPTKTAFYRTKPAEGIIKLYRELRKGGFI